MANKSPNWFYILLFGFVIIGNFPFLIPFLIFGLLVYFFVFKNDKNIENYKELINQKTSSNREYIYKFKQDSPDAYNKISQVLKNKLDIDIEDKSKISKINNNISTLYKDNLIPPQKNTIKQYYPKNSKVLNKFQPKTKYDGKSIWDNYESVLDKFPKK